MRTTLGILAALTVVGTTPSHAQDAGSALTGATDPFYRDREITARDSINIWRAARSRQFRFETIRRSKLPPVTGQLRRECDYSIGRLCYWDRVRDTGTPKPEDPVVTEARLALLAALDSAANLIPGDEWIANQRVRYLVEARRRDDALKVAEKCGSKDPWWCHALVGYVLHSFLEFSAAESQFKAALNTMPDSERCRWNDLSAILEKDLLKVYRSLECTQRDSLERRIWWLADPLYMVDGNDRLSEHYARRTFDRMIRRAETAYGVYWSTDIRAVLTRYGWPTRWQRAVRGRDQWTAMAIVSYHEPHAGHFIPRLKVVEDPVGSTAEDWVLPKKLIPRTRYAPSYAVRFDSLGHQLAAFKRADSMIVVGAYRWFLDTPDSLTPAIEAGLTLMHNELSDTVMTYRKHAASEGVLMATTAAVDQLASLETLSRSLKRAGRVRYGLAPPTVLASGLGLSDVLLLEVSDEPAHNLDQAAALARKSFLVSPREPLALFWEVYSPPSGDSLSLSVSVKKGNKNLLKDGQGQIRWKIRAEKPDGILPQTISIQLPELKEGRYTLLVEVRNAGDEAVESSLPLIVPKKKKK